jgi:hypothetical protein
MPGAVSYKSVLLKEFSNSFRLISAIVKATKKGNIIYDLRALGCEAPATVGILYSGSNGISASNTIKACNGISALTSKLNSGQVTQGI